MEGSFAWGCEGKKEWRGVRSEGWFVGGLGEANEGDGWKLKVR